MSNNLPQFKAQLAQMTAAIQEHGFKVLAGHIAHLWRDLMVKTPRASGWASFNWNCSAEAPDFGVIDEKTRSARAQGGDAITGESVLEARWNQRFQATDRLVLQKLKGASKIYLANGTPYLGELEHGFRTPGGKQIPGRHFIAASFEIFKQRIGSGQLPPLAIEHVSLGQAQHYYAAREAKQTAAAQKRKAAKLAAFEALHSLDDLVGKTISLTGVFTYRGHSYRPPLARMLLAVGVHLTRTVTKNTDFLLTSGESDTQSSKQNAARQQGVPAIAFDVFLNQIDPAGVWVKTLAKRSGERVKADGVESDLAGSGIRRRTGRPRGRPKGRKDSHPRRRRSR